MARESGAEGVPRWGFAVVLVLLAGLWERAMRLGPAYDPVAGVNASALAECDWGNIIVATAVLLPLCVIGLLGLRAATWWLGFLRLLLALITMPMIALTLFLLLGLRDFVD